MKARLCIAAMAACVGSIAMAAPIVTPGLWESTTSMTGVTPTPQTMTMQNCITPELAARMGQDEDKPKNPACTFVDKNVRADGFSAHMVCQRAQGKSDMKMSVTWISSTAYKGTMEITSPNGKVIDTTFSAKYLGPNCGDAQPMAPLK